MLRKLPTTYDERHAMVTAAATYWDRRPFAWGRADCLLFCNAMAKAVTGRDYAAAFVPYDQRFANSVLMRPRGLKRFMVKLLGEPSRPAALLPGDPVLVSVPLVASTAGVLWDYETAVIFGPPGELVKVPRKRIRWGWTLGS